MNAANLAELFPGALPKVVPALDFSFRPAVLINRAFKAAATDSGQARSVRIGLEQADGSVSHFATRVLPALHPQAAANFPYIERLVKFLLWSRGGYRIYLDGPEELGRQLRQHFETTATGRFDADLMGRRVYEKPFEVVQTPDLPPERAASTPLGRRLEGCRIGFDLGGSDRKVAAVRDGQVLFSEETIWDPYPQSDPQYHFDGIMDSLRQAAAHLPKVEAIGGSAAGVYVNNQVKVASLFRGVPPDVFQKRVKGMFFDVQKAWGGVPLEVVNDGEVTALAGSMALGKNAVLGVAMGTSQAGGYVNHEGNITTWLNELAFVPVDYSPQAHRDEWSGDVGCGAQYFSQQAVGRLLGPAGIPLPDSMSLADKLKEVQRLMDQEDPRARTIFETIGVYLGYAMAHYADFYPCRHVLVLGRVTSGPGGDIILSRARQVLASEFGSLAETLEFHVPDEKDKRHGQAIAAASLPAIPRDKTISEPNATLATSNPN
jgi:predicted NBD/HSP70 family sugar kinase